MSFVSEMSVISGEYLVLYGPAHLGWPRQHEKDQEQHPGDCWVQM